MVALRAPISILALDAIMSTAHLSQHIKNTFKYSEVATKIHAPHFSSPDLTKNTSNQEAYFYYHWESPKTSGSLLRAVEAAQGFWGTHPQVPGGSNRSAPGILVTFSWVCIYIVFFKKNMHLYQYIMTIMACKHPFPLLFSFSACIYIYVYYVCNPHISSESKLIQDQ